MAETSPRTFADRLRSLREAAGVTQYRLAQLSGVTKQTLSRLELGQTQPSWDTVQALARGLGVSCDAFADPDAAARPVNVEPPRGRGRPPKSQGDKGKAAPSTPPAGEPKAAKKPRGRAGKGK